VGFLIEESRNPMKMAKFSYWNIWWRIKKR